MSFRVPAAAAVLVWAACDSTPKPRRYVEVAFRAKSMPGMAMMEAPVQVTWAMPDGWVQEPGGDPLRLATFRAPDPDLAHTGELDPGAVDVSIVQLAGEAGGVAANVKRWMGQLKIAVTPDQIQALIHRAAPIQAVTGQKGLFIDFTETLSGDMTQSISILSGIFQGEGYTVFVKAMGDRDRLVKLKTQMRDFCQTVSITEEKK